MTNIITSASSDQARYQSNLCSFPQGHACSGAPVSLEAIANLAHLHQQPSCPTIASEKVDPADEFDPPYGESEIAARLWKLGFHALANAVDSCGRTYASFMCASHGEFWHRRLVCRFAACERCRRRGSEAERLKKAKTLAKFEKARGLYKLVLTLPPVLRDLLFIFDADASQSHFSSAVLGRLFKVSADFAIRVLGTDAIEVAFHPIGDLGEYNPHFEVLAPFWEGEWHDPRNDELVKQWLSAVHRRWAEALRCAFKLGEACPRTVLVEASFGDNPVRIAQLVGYAVGHHWARRPKRISDAALCFLALLRGHRLHRGYGNFADKKWIAFVASKPGLSSPKSVVSTAPPISLRHGCPLHGSELHYQGRDGHVGSHHVEVSPGLWTTKETAATLQRSRRRKSWSPQNCSNYGSGRSP